MTFSSGVVTDQTLAVQPDGSLVLSWDTPRGDGNRVFHCPWYRTFDLAMMFDSECTFST